MAIRVLGSKKGIGVGQVFVYISAAIVFSFVLIFGYRAVDDFLTKGETVEFIQFKNELESSIKQIYSEFGAVRVKEYFLPLSYEQVCFVDLESEYNPALCSYDFVACDLWQTAWETSQTEGSDPYAAADTNVFLTPASPVALKVFSVDIEGEASGEEGFLCLPINSGRFRLRLEGRGSRTRISALG